jgi:superfamily I DNA/RNA helicase
MNYLSYVVYKCCDFVVLLLTRKLIKYTLFLFIYMTQDLDYLFVLKALKEIPFPVGKKLLIDFLKGNEKNASIIRNNLNNLDSFGALSYSEEDILAMIDNLILNDMISFVSVVGNRFWKVIEISQKGILEIQNPQFYKKKVSFNFKETKTEVTTKDKEIFSLFGSFLEKYNDLQKKAIISNNKHVLCIAGAGSGKTTVLTKRIEFMIKYRSVPASKILAITFTRKARTEMKKRLDSVNLEEVMVETFNSYCEKILKNYSSIIYDKPTHVLSYGDKIKIIRKAILMLKMDVHSVINAYFSYSQKRNKTNDQLFNIFLNDCFLVRDYLKSKNEVLDEASFVDGCGDDQKNARMIYAIVNYIEGYMKKEGFRDFADQLIDTIAFFEKHPEIIPSFDHILVDEYQDVNSTQIKLIELLSPKNLFFVGDPRQSIFGWRGSNIKYILKFKDDYPDSKIITLTKNYRSSEAIVNVINDSIRSMNLANLESVNKWEKDVNLLKFATESSEFDFIISTILKSNIPRNEIFVLARTNRKLALLSQTMKQKKIKHVVRSDEIKRTKIITKDDVTLATIHAIKGLEAELVFVIGCTGLNFPCKGSEHPVIEMIKINDYDKEEEERRLFYVAMSRAKKSLYLTYSGKKPTYFINDSMKRLIEGDDGNKKNKMLSLDKAGNVSSRLKEWRLNLSKELEVPAFIIMKDITLIDIAIKMPMTLSDLESIVGLGPLKISKYGEDILKIIR